jgi:hypothetical protein
MPIPIAIKSKPITVADRDMMIILMRINVIDKGETADGELFMSGLSPAVVPSTFVESQFICFPF